MPDVWRTWKPTVKRFEGSERFWGLTRNGSEYVNTIWGDEIPDEMDYGGRS